MSSRANDAMQTENLKDLATIVAERVDEYVAKLLGLRLGLTKGRGGAPFIVASNAADTDVRSEIYMSWHSHCGLSAVSFRCGL